MDSYHLPVCSWVPIAVLLAMRALSRGDMNERIRRLQHVGVREL